MEWSLKKVDDAEYPYLDQNGVSHTSPEAWFWIEILGGCGCGSSEEFAGRAVALLRHFGTEWDDRKGYPDDEFSELLAHWFDSHDLIEHGSSIGGSWLSNKGQAILNVIEGATEEARI